MSVQKNTAGVSHAKSLIGKGAYVATGSWSITSADKRAMLGTPANYTTYKKWFLGIDTEKDKDTMGAYKYPFGKRGKVYRSALIAIRQRSAQQGLTSIYNAAGTLLTLLDKKEEAKASLSFAQYAIREMSRNIV